MVLNFLCRIGWRVEGDILSKRPVVIASNHQGLWESFYLQTLANPLTTIIKKELVYVPFFGWSLNLLNPIKINRSKKIQSAKKVIKIGTQKLSNGYSILLFPEGTRKSPGKQVGKFARSAADLAIKNNVCAVVDAGVAPGIPNFLLGYWDSKIKVNSFDYLVGGLPKNPLPPYNYKAPFSPIDVIEEYTRPARMMINSKIVIKPALSEIEELDIIDAGKLEAFNTDGLRSLLITMDHIPNMKEKTLRYPGHAALIQSMIDKHLFDKNNFDGTVSKLFNDWKLKEDEPEFTVLDINIYGNEKDIHYHLYDEMDIISKSSSMARTTGYTATATINMLLKEIWSTKGVSPPEIVGANEDCTNFLLEYLSSRSVKVLRS